MIEDEGAQQVVAFYDAILESRGIRLAPDSMILDYGCGSGRHTYEYLDAGYCNAFGYDLQNYVALRAPKDRERFRFDPIPGNAGGYPRMSEFPWPADTFHFIFATSVFEHVADQELAYAEIHRVLKPGGAFLNIFPSKWRPIEAHINILACSRRTASTICPGGRSQCCCAGFSASSNTSRTPTSVTARAGQDTSRFR